MGAVKAGVTVVTFEEKDNIDALREAIKESGCRGIMFSPGTEIDVEKQVSRGSFMKKVLPELENLYPGDPIEIKEFSNLKQVIQLGHSNIRGVIKFRDAMIYADPKFSSRQIQENDANDKVYECYRNGKEVSSFTSGEMVS
jgi:hypothetical protein